MHKARILIGILIFLNVATLALSQGCEQEVKIFKIEHGNAESLCEVANNLKSKDGKVSFESSTSSLVVLDCPQNIERIAGVIKSLDVQEKMVEIRVSVIEATAGFFENIGVNASQVIIPQAKFRAIASLLKSSEQTNLRSEIMLKTLSNHPVLLQVTKDEIIGSELVILGDGTEIVSAVREPIGDFLEVLPIVNNDGTIKVVLRPSVSTLQADATPSERTILTQAVINSGDTIAIGGAEAERGAGRKKDTLFGLPLARKAASEKKRVEMFLTARIIE